MPARISCYINDMSKNPNKKSLKLNFIMNSLLTISAFVFPLITFPYVSRILLPVGIGRVSFANSVVSYFALFAQLGIPTYGIRACAKVRDNKIALSRTVHELFIINMAVSIIAYMSLYAMIVFVPRLHQERILFYIVSSTIFFNAIGMEWMYKALEQYSYITIRSIIFKLIALIALFLFVHKQSDYVIYGGITILASSASNIFNFLHAHRYIYIRPVGAYNFRRHLKATMIFFAVSCASMIYTYLDTVMLGFIATDADVGFYNTAVKIKIILVGIVTSLGAVLLPRASYYVENGQMDEFYRITKKAINFVFIISVPMMVYFMLFAKEGIYFLAGEAYEDSVIPMQIIMPTLVFIGLSGVMGFQMLVPLGREKVVLYSEIVGGVVDLILNALLIPKITAAGAAIGTLVAEAVVWLVQYYALRDIVKKAYRGVRFSVIAVGIVLGSGLGMLVKCLKLGDFMTLALSSFLFWGAYAVVLLRFKEPLAIEIEAQVLRKLRR